MKVSFGWMCVHQDQTKPRPEAKFYGFTIKTRMGTTHLAGEIQPVQRSLLRESCTREKEAPRQEGT
jgi:hypothetical protein